MKALAHFATNSLKSGLVIDKLKYYEDKLHIYEKNNKLRDALDKDNLKEIVEEVINS